MNILWSDKKRPLFGLPISFTKYTLTDEKFLVKMGLLSITEEEVQLYRIVDIRLHKNIFQRMFHVGTISCFSSDKTTPDFDIKDIKEPDKVKEMLSHQVEVVREKKAISVNEFLYNK